MTSRERVLAALRCVDHVLLMSDHTPYCEFGIDPALAQRIMGWGEPVDQAADLESNPYSVDEAKAIAARLGLDNIYYVLRPPTFVEKAPGVDGRLFYGKGLVQTRADLARMELPDPDDDALYEGARQFAEQKGDYAATFVTRAGVFPTILSMGLEPFCIALFEDRPLVEAILDLFFDWSAAIAERVCAMGFDFYVSTDDMAFKTAPLFSPAVFRELAMPRYRRLAERITLPWVVHSDGNLMPFVDDLLTLGIAGLHPNEKGAVDIREMKRRYGGRLCLLGNVDLNILGIGTPQEVDDEVRELIRDVGPGGGYIVTSGNSLAGYLKPENVLALAEAVQRYG